MDRLIELITSPKWIWYVLTRRARTIRRGLSCRLGHHKLQHYMTGQGMRAYCLQSTYCRGKVHKP